MDPQAIIIQAAQAAAAAAIAAAAPGGGAGAGLDPAVMAAAIQHAITLAVGGAPPPGGDRPPLPPLPPGAGAGPHQVGWAAAVCRPLNATAAYRLQTNPLDGTRPSAATHGHLTSSQQLGRPGHGATHLKLCGTMSDRSQ